jgi:hypothetical protein
MVTAILASFERATSRPTPNRHHHGLNALSPNARAVLRDASTRAGVPWLGEPIVNWHAVAIIARKANASNSKRGPKPVTAARQIAIAALAKLYANLQGRSPPNVVFPDWTKNAGRDQSKLLRFLSSVCAVYGVDFVAGDIEDIARAWPTKAVQTVLGK